MGNDIYYLTIGQIQDTLDAHYKRFGSCICVAEAMEQLRTTGQYSETLTNYKYFPTMSHLDFDDFVEQLRNIQIEVNAAKIEVMKKDISHFPLDRVDVYLEPSFHHDFHTAHSHENFQMVYIYRGSYRFQFLDEEQLLTEGDFVIISPNSVHTLMENSDDAFMVSFYLNLKTMNTTFLSILQGGDFLANFFKEVLTNQNHSNYLLLSTGQKDHLKYQVQDMLVEQHKYDRFSPICSLSQLKVFLAGVMRCYTSFRQYSACGSRMDFGPVLEYISHHYKTASLGEIAEHFNYSSSYLSTMIHHATGKTYSCIIREARLQEAQNYLDHSNHTIAEVAQLCGYNSVDHFTKTFRAEYGCSPKQYQQKRRAGQ